MLSLLAACQPALNWREARPTESGAVALFPCKPEVEQRPARAGEGAMGLAHCEAAGLSFALSWADMRDPTEAGAALRAMPRALAAKLKQPLPLAQGLQVAGMTPLPEASQHRLEGSGGVTRVAVFAYGGRVYQALMSADHDDAPAWDAFVSGLKVGSAARPAG
jgi:hypothetical protein